MIFSSYFPIPFSLHKLHTPNIFRKQTVTPTSSPTSSPTTSPTSSPTSSPTLPHVVSPNPPPSGGLPALGGDGCMLNVINAPDNGCPVHMPYCMEGIDGNGVCSECRNDNADCKTSAPYCVRVMNSAFACAECNITDGASCPGGETCGTPSCISDMMQYCSKDHDADWNCDYMRSILPSSAPTDDEDED